jgi:hypothetical protein
MLFSQQLRAPQEIKMSGKQHEIYQNYVKTTTVNNVRPTELEGEAGWAFLKENGVKFDNPSTFTVKFFDGGKGARAWTLCDGRVIEYAPGAFGRSLFAVFDKAIDWVNYRRPMGRFHYLYT